jgi:hypothetical protein
MHVYKGREITAQELNESEKIVGAYLTSSRKLVSQDHPDLPALTGCVILENYFEPQPTNTILHEQQHQWTDFFTSNQSMKSKKEFAPDFDPHSEDENAKSLFISEYLIFKIKETIKKHAKDEILAYYKENYNFKKIMPRLDFDFQEYFTSHPETFADQFATDLNKIISQNNIKFKNNSPIRTEEIKLLIPEIYQKVYPLKKFRLQILSARLALEKNNLPSLQIIGKVIDKDILEWTKIEF